MIQIIEGEVVLTSLAVTGRDENALAQCMSKLITHMGANIRAYHFFVFSDTDWL